MPKKFIFITGAANGIGKETAKLFVQKGWFAGLFDLDEKNLRNLKEELGQHKCEIYLGDVTDLEGLRAAFRSFSVRTNGLIHVLFNNAGIIRAGEFDEIPMNDQHKIIDVNIKGVMNGTSAALPYLKKTPGSRIISMCSASALFGHPELTAYAASKSAVQSLTEGWSVAFKKYDIKVSDILPLFVMTGLVTDIAKHLRLTEKDVKLTPGQIAKVVWKASHRYKLHWSVGSKTKFFKFLMRFLPDRLNRYIFKRVIKYK